MSFLVYLILIATPVFAEDPLRQAVETANMSLETVNHPASDLPCVGPLSPAEEWARKNIQQLDNVPEENRGSLYFMISTFQCRLDNWRAYKPFYDRLFSQPEIQRAYPDALPQDQTENGFFIRILNPGQKITDNSPLAHLTGKTIEEVFGYPGDRRVMDETPGMASRQLMFLQPSYITRQHTGRYNEGYHEFGHLLHLTLMTPTEYHQIEELYRTKKASGMFFNNYASQSSSEYFAQGLEAYLSETKPRLSANVSRKELQEKDPALFEFIRDFVESSREGCAEKISDSSN